MTDRDDPGGGGLTGVTGDLTPDESDEAFVPGERREIEDPEARARVTTEHAASVPPQQAEPQIGGDERGESEDRF